MFRLSVIILFLGLFITAYSQNTHKIDSLNNILKIVKSDTAKIRILNGLSAQYYNFDLEAAQKFAEQALSLAKIINYQKSIALSLNSLGDVFYYKGKHDKSKELYLQSLKIYETVKDKKGISVCLQDMATIFREEGNYPEAINFYQKALKINEDIGNKKGIAFANVNIGVLFTDLEKYDKALDYLLKALEVLKSSNEPAGLANCWIIKQFENLKMNQFENEEINEKQFPNFQISKFSNLIELKGDKQPIGIHSNMQPFTNQNYQLQKGDIIYLMSDGFEDQFGGPNRKKFLAKNLKNLLIANCQLPMTEQKETLFKIFESWRGEHAQVDDILLIGFKCNT